MSGDLGSLFNYLTAKNSHSIKFLYPFKVNKAILNTSVYPTITFYKNIVFFISKCVKKVNCTFICGKI